MTDTGAMERNLALESVRVTEAAAIGVDEVSLMPDTFGIAKRALAHLKLPYRVSHMEMLVTGTPADSLHAAQELREREAGCVVVLGGDGTHRMVAKGCGGVPQNLYIDQGHVIYDFICGGEISVPGIEAKIINEVNPETCE